MDFNILSVLNKLIPRSYRSESVILTYKSQLDIIGKIIEQKSEQELMELLTNIHQIEKINIAGKSEIVRLINTLHDVLKLVDKQSGYLLKLMGNGDKYIVESLQNKLSNYWLWIIAIYFLQGNKPEYKALFIKYQLLKNIQHLCPYSLDEVAKLPNGTDKFYRSETENTPEGNFFLYHDLIEQYLIRIKSTFLSEVKK